MGDKTPVVLGLSPQDFQKKLARLIAEARAFAVAEDLESISVLLSDWLPDLRRQVAEAVAVLSDLEKIADLATGERADIRRGWSRDTGTLILPRAFEELADLCFVAAAECRACQRELEPLSDESEQFTLLVVMERSQSRLSGSLCAVEARLARMSGHDSRTRHVDLGRKTLRARGLIAQFRRRSASVARQAEDDVAKTLRSCGNSLAWLIGHDHFGNLRASDRLTAKLLHQRTLDWLRASGASDDDGLRLWHDVSAFVELLRLINRRPEIVQHDLKIVLQAMSVLADSDPHGPLPCSVVEPLNSILGRDEVLDEMLGTDVDTARVLARLVEVYSVLERDGAPAHDPGSGPPAGGFGGGELSGIAGASGKGRPEAPSAAGARPPGPKAWGNGPRAVA